MCGRRLFLTRRSLHRGNDKRIATARRMTSSSSVGDGRQSYSVVLEAHSIRPPVCGLSRAPARLLSLVTGGCRRALPPEIRWHGRSTDVGYAVMATACLVMVYRTARNYTHDELVDRLRGHRAREDPRAARVWSLSAGGERQTIDRSTAAAASAAAKRHT